jgi:hypothetical protein
LWRRDAAVVGDAIAMKDFVLDMLREHILLPPVSIANVIDRHDQITVFTDGGLYTARYDTSSWIGKAPTRIAREPFVDKYLVIHDESVEDPDIWPVYGFLLLVDGGVLFLNDEGQMAELGKRLGGDLSAEAYAEVLARFHGPRTGYMGHLVVGDRDQVKTEPGAADLSELHAPLLSRGADGYTLTFYSVDHPRHVGDQRVVEVCRWTAIVTDGEPARWRIETIHRDLPWVSPLALHVDSAERPPT